MEVKYITHSGDDLLVVNAARVSMAKKSEEFTEKDKKLINYLAKHNHWTPFGHPHVTLHLKVPIFVARQLMRSNVGIVYNEVSRRYVDEELEFWWPENFEWRKRADKVKQGSSKETRKIKDETLAVYAAEPIDLAGYQYIVKEVYDNLLAYRVAPELARIVLPQNMYTEFYMTGSLAAFARVCKLRFDSHAQKEIRDVVAQISKIMEELFPVSWKALMEN